MEFIFHTVELFNLSLYILDFASIIESTMSNSTIDLTTPYESKNETHTSETMASESTTSQSTTSESTTSQSKIFFFIFDCFTDTAETVRLEKLREITYLT